jgi:hypothetical protein
MERAIEAFVALTSLIVGACYGVLKNRAPFDPKWTSRIAT